jgi:hypothetical protein
MAFDDDPSRVVESLTPKLPCCFMSLSITDILTRQSSNLMHFVDPLNGRKRSKETTKGWELLVKRKDGSEVWVPLKDVKETYPGQVAEYAVQFRIQDEPAFAWRAPHVLK